MEQLKNIEAPNVEWQDPRQKIWGFHVHQELPHDDFAKALVIQSACANFMADHHIPIDAADAIKPGYGPHLDYMWELRVENAPQESVLEKLGLALSYMAINRFGLSAYIHPLMHDVALPAEEALAAEGLHNQQNTIWFSYKVPQKQSFFFAPDKDEHNNIIDTRTPRIITPPERRELARRGKRQLQRQTFQTPDETIVGGFHLHVDYSPAQEPLALLVFEQFLSFLRSEDMHPTSTRIYTERENGPHLQRGWEVKFETDDRAILSRIGIAIAWLMCNRHGLSVFMHPVTWHEGDLREELKAHEDYSFFIGDLPPLNLGFFSDQIVDSAVRKTA